LKLKVPEDSAQQPVITVRQSKTSAPPVPEPTPGPSDVEATTPADPSELAEPNHDRLETLEPTWLADSDTDQNPRAGDSSAIEATVGLTAAGPADLAAGLAGAATVAFGSDQSAEKSRPKSRSEDDSDADFLSAVARASSPQTPVAEQIPSTLGGYKVQKELGRGGMGSVYLARQLSLDRDVALKVMAAKWARDPTLLARFTREAYSAAQLVHHNIVQIYDFGSDQGINYFSMEYVDGQTLGDLIRNEGVMAPAVAVSHILQACRGLKVAHDHGMIHRDIKPDNLMLNRYGVVKLADLGLVKVGGDKATERPDITPSSGGPEGESEQAELAPNVTRVRAAMGTPSYMAPEQAKDAASVGRAADIYSLGCTLYALVTGRPPFLGKTALELMTKHASEPVIPPDAVVEQVPQELSEIVLKMVAKNPEERYQSIDEVITELEGLLAIDRTAPIAPRPEEAELLEACVNAFDSTPATRLRTRVFLGFFIACVLGILFSLWAGGRALALGILGIGVLTPLAYAIRDAISRETPLYLSVRQFLVESRPGERIAMAVGVILLLAFIVLTHPSWLIVIAAAAVLSHGASLLLDRKLIQERREPIERIQDVLKNMRLRGLDEETIRRVMAERCGPRWDALKDALFGKEGHLIALHRWGRAEWDRARPKLAVWRDAALAWIEEQLQARWEARARRHLQHVEEESLKAQGMGFFEARRQARRVADALVAQARDLHEVSIKASRAVMESLASDESRRRIFQKLRAAAERPEQLIESMERGLLARRSDESLSTLIGPRVRFIAGIVLLMGYLIWLFQNSADTADTPTEPLWLPLVPSFLSGVVRDMNAGVAGLILLASALVPGWRISLVVIPAAAVALLGSTLGIPAPLGLLAALALTGGGVYLGRVAGAAPQATAGEKI
jgi:serine/threonine protein kinase